MTPLLRTLPFILMLCFGSIFGQQATGRNARVQLKPTTDFEVTGDGTAASWKTTEWISLPKLAGAANYTTQAKLLYSEKGIYALFNCEDKKITSTKTEDFTELWKEDVIEIFFWPDEANILYFEYELSPLNHELPLLIPNTNGDFLGWRPWQYEGDRKTRHQVKITKDVKGNSAWMCEFFIPFQLMRPLGNVPPKKGMQWRMNMYRIDYDDTPSTKWGWQSVKTNFHEYNSFGTLVFE